MRSSSPLITVILVITTSLVMISLPALLGARGAPSPIPVSFGPNINLSVQNYSKAVNQGETTVAANPKDPLNLVAGTMDHIPNPSQDIVSFFFTKDGGQSWVLGGAAPLESDGDFAADPAIASDAAGNFYYSYLDADSSFSRIDIVVAKSTDGGRTFPTFAIAVHSNFTTSPTIDPDKDFIGIDARASSPFKGTIYVTWSNLGDSGYQIMVVTSGDGGVTWSAPKAVSPVGLYSNSEFVSGPVPVVGPDGTVYIFYADVILSTGPLSIKFSRSKDGGRTWSAPASVASGLPSPGLFTLKNDDPNFGTKPFVGIVADSLPTVAIGPDGTIFVAWTDFPSGSCTILGSGLGVACVNSDVRLSVSRNGGKTWSTPVKVSDETNATDQFLPWIDVHPNGLLSLAWEDKRLDPDNIDYDTFYTNTFDGRAFLRNVRVSTATSLSGNQQAFVGHYNGLAATVDRVFPVWSDMRSGSPDVYVAVGRFTP